MSGGSYFLKFMPISFFRRVSRFFEVFSPGAPMRKILVYTGVRPCLVALDDLKLCKINLFVSRSDLILISFWMLTMPWIFYSISFYRRVSRFVVFQTKVAPLCFPLLA